MLSILFALFLTAAKAQYNCTVQAHCDTSVHGVQGYQTECRNGYCTPILCDDSNACSPTEYVCAGDSSQQYRYCMKSCTLNPGMCNPEYGQTCDDQTGKCYLQTCADGYCELLYAQSMQEIGFTFLWQCNTTDAPTCQTHLCDDVHTCPSGYWCSDQTDNLAPLAVCRPDCTGVGTTCNDVNETCNVNTGECSLAPGGACDGVNCSTSVYAMQGYQTMCYAGDCGRVSCDDTNPCSDSNYYCYGDEDQTRYCYDPNCVNTDGYCEEQAVEMETQIGFPVIFECNTTTAWCEFIPCDDSHPCASGYWCDDNAYGVMCRPHCTGAGTTCDDEFETCNVNIGECYVPNCVNTDGYCEEEAVEIETFGFPVIFECNTTTAWCEFISCDDLHPCPLGYWCDDNAYGVMCRAQCTGAGTACDDEFETCNVNTGECSLTSGDNGTVTVNIFNLLVAVVAVIVIGYK